MHSAARQAAQAGRLKAVYIAAREAVHILPSDMSAGLRTNARGLGVRGFVTSSAPAAACTQDTQTGCSPRYLYTMASTMAMSDTWRQLRTCTRREQPGAGQRCKSQ
jgi:hypothetical protein